MATTYNAHENTITGWANVPLEAFHGGKITMGQIKHQISKQIGAEIGRNELGEIEYSENHKFHTLDVKLTVAVLSMEKYREMNELISDLTNDNAEMLETIESLQESLEKASRENESLRFRVSDLELKLKRGEPPMVPPFSMQIELDDAFKRFERQQREFGFRGGKRP